MPNYCLNKLTIEHSDPSMVDRFEKAYNLGKTCNEFIPEPEGYSDDDRWYDWRIANWGTKWDIGADIGTDREEWHGLKATRVGNQVCCSFDSPWAPPIQLYETLVDLGYNVKASYFEPGMAFCGIWDNGDDNYIEFSRYNNPEEAIPVALWNEYNMKQFFEDIETKT